MKNSPSGQSVKFMQMKAGEHQSSFEENLPLQRIWWEEKKLEGKGKRKIDNDDYQA